MKIYNVTRWMKIPVTTTVGGEKELEQVKKMTNEQFIEYFNQNTDRDEQQAYWEGTSYEEVGEQEIECIGEEDDQ